MPPPSSLAASGACPRIMIGPSSGTVVPGNGLAITMVPVSQEWSYPAAVREIAYSFPPPATAGAPRRRSTTRVPKANTGLPSTLTTRTAHTTGTSVPPSTTAAANNVTRACLSGPFANIDNAKARPHGRAFLCIKKHISSSNS